MLTVLEKELTHYRIPVFEALQRRMREEVRVFHVRPPPGSALNTAGAGDELPFSHRLLATRWLAGDRCFVHDPLTPVCTSSRPRAAILRHSVRNLTFFPVMAALRVRGVPLVGWGQGYSRTRRFDPGSDLRDRAHLAVVESCDAYVCYSEEIREMLGRHVDPERLFVARNTLDTGPIAELRREFAATGVTRLRRDLGLERSRYLSFVGRLEERKKPWVLLDVHEALRRDEGLDVGLLVVGDGPLRPALEDRADRRGLDDVHFVGAKYGREAAKYLFASDVMVMPGWLGLAVVHAFALGVPVVTQRGGPGLLGHPPEAGYVRDGENGFMTPEGDLAILVEAVGRVLDGREEFSRSAAAFADENLSLEGMVDGFREAVRFAAA